MALSANDADDYDTSEAVSKQIFTSYVCKSSASRGLPHAGDIAEASSLRWGVLGVLSPSQHSSGQVALLGCCMGDDLLPLCTCTHLILPRCSCASHAVVNGG